MRLSRATYRIAQLSTAMVLCLSCGFLAPVRAQPTSLALPPQLDFSYHSPDYLELLAHDSRRPDVIARWSQLAFDPSQIAVHPPEHRQKLLSEMAVMHAGIPDDDAHWQYVFTQNFTVAYLRVGDISRSTEVLEEFHRKREKYHWDHPRYRWKMEAQTDDWLSMRFIPNIEDLLVQRARKWRGLGVTPGETHTPQSLIDLEYILFHLGGHEGRLPQFLDLRPRILASFPAGHPMRSLCEARWSFTLRKLGRFSEARAVVAAAMKDMTLTRPYPNRRLELSLISEASSLYMTFGEFAIARELNTGVPEDIEAIYPAGHFAHGYAWGHRAMILTGLGDYDGAIAAWKKSALTDKTNARMRLGILLLQLGQVDEGKRLVEEHVDANYVWTAWGWLGAVAMTEHYLQTGDAVRAAEWLRGGRKAVELLSPDSVPETAYLLLLESRIAELRGEPALRRKILAEALAMASSGRNEINRVRVLFEWSDLLAGEANPVAAIAMGKNAAKRLQVFRLEASRGEKAESTPLQHSFQPALQRLNERLIDAGRLPEVEQILAVLNEERYFDFVRSARRYAADGNIGFDATEERLQADLGVLESASVSAHEKIEQHWLKPTAGEAPARAQAQSRPTNLFARDLRNRLQEQASQLIERQTVDATGALPEATTLSRPSGIDPATEKTVPQLVKGSPSLAISPGTAMVTLLSSAKGFSMLIETERGIEVISQVLDMPQLNRAIQRFRQVLARPDIDAKPAAVALYDLMFKVTDAALKRQSIKRVYLAVDGALRYLPFAALHDGQQYLVNRYVFATASAAGMTERAVSVAPAKLSFAVFAASQFDSPELLAAKLDAAPLPNAIRELDSTANALASRSGIGTASGRRPADLGARGQRFAEFSRKQLTETMEGTFRPNIVHIASHFQFSPAAEADSKLLTSDGFVTLREIAGWNWQGTDLVTFSACNTGLAAATSATTGYSGGPHEVVLRAGARSVIASLWMVNDASTATFMPKMYRDPAPVADWGTRINNTQRWFARGGAGDAYMHPHHWAAFVLHTRVRF